MQSKITIAITTLRQHLMPPFLTSGGCFLSMCVSLIYKPISCGTLIGQF